MSMQGLPEQVIRTWHGQQHKPHMSRKKQLEQVIRTWALRQCKQPQCRRERSLQENKTLKKEMYGRPAQNAPAVFTVRQVHCFFIV